MSEGFYLGLGLALVLRFVQWAVPAMPKSIGWSGTIAGVVVMMAEFVERSMRPPLGSVVLFLLAAVCLGGSIHLYLNRSAKAQTSMPDKTTTNQVTGAKIEGNNQGGAAAEIVNSGGGTGANIDVTGAPGQSVTGLRVQQTGPGTGLKVIQSGPGTGLSVKTTIGKPD